MRKNASGADNQQGNVITAYPQRLYARPQPLINCWVMIQSDLHGDMQTVGGKSNDPRTE